MHTRSTAAAQSTAENFADLSVVGSGTAPVLKRRVDSTPSYINGRLYTVAGARRHVVADPESGATIWSYREPDTERWEY